MTKQQADQMNSRFLVMKTEIDSLKIQCKQNADWRNKFMYVSKEKELAKRDYHRISNIQSGMFFFIFIVMTYTLYQSGN